MSPSALSQTIRSLQKGLRLLIRTTRGVALTGAGERLFRTLRPRFEAIQAQLAELTALRDQLAGKIRISAGGRAAITALQSALKRILPRYPDIQVEITVDPDMSDT